LIDIARSLFDHMRLIRFRTSAFPPRLESALAQHLQLVEAFEKKDSHGAERLMRAHIEESAQYIDKWEQMYSDSLPIDEASNSTDDDRGIAKRVEG
jgi:DNA-binding GntR family transcriptional regulator